jgi:hypothetical protein
VLAALCVVTSCGGRDAAPSPSPSPFEFNGTPSALVLREGDLPVGFHVRYESSVGPFEIAELLTTDTASSASAADALLKRGLASSYARSFDFADSKQKRIASIVMLFRDAQNAQEAVQLLAGYARDLGCKEIPVGMKLGDVSRACGGRFVSQDTPGSAVYLYFSSNNAVAYIGISDDADADDGELIGTLATKQLKSMRSFGGAELKGK